LRIYSLQVFKRRSDARDELAPPLFMLVGG
jgi:hypothetical protein